MSEPRGREMSLPGTAAGERGHRSTSGGHRSTPGGRLAKHVGAVGSVGLAAALLLMTAAMVVPAATDWDVRIGFPPVYAHWDPRLGPGSLLAIPLALAGIVFAGQLSHRLSWRGLLAACWLTGLAWLAALALVDGSAGLSTRIDTADLMETARRTTDVSQLLHGFASRIPLDAKDSWPVHVAGHPPGALLFFVVLARLGLGNMAVGVVITLLASTIPLGVLVTLRTLGADGAARSAAPFLVLAPAAVEAAVSADAVFSFVACWGLACLALAAVRRSVGWALLAGVLLGCCVLMSYGLVLLGFLAIGVLAAARSYRPVGWAAAAALSVVLVFWAAGFSLIAAYPLLRERYLVGIASLRPAAYWLWGDLAALCFAAGPVLGAGVACLISRLRMWRELRSGEVGGSDIRVVVIVGGAAVLAIIAADLSLMSKAEVERIWLPFVPWLLVLSALLPQHWHRRALTVQVVFALMLQHLLATAW